MQIFSVGSGSVRPATFRIESLRFGTEIKNVDLDQSLSLQETECFLFDFTQGKLASYCSGSMSANLTSQAMVED